MSCWFRSSIGPTQIQQILYSGLKHPTWDHKSGFRGPQRTVAYLHVYSISFLLLRGLKNWWGESYCSLASQLYSWTRSSVINCDPYLIIRLLKGLWILHQRHFCQPDHHCTKKSSVMLVFDWPTKNEQKTLRKILPKWPYYRKGSHLHIPDSDVSEGCQRPFRSASKRAITAASIFDAGSLTWPSFVL